MDFRLVDANGFLSIFLTGMGAGQGSDMYHHIEFFSLKRAAERDAVADIKMKGVGPCGGRLVKAVGAGELERLTEAANQIPSDKTAGAGNQQTCFCRGLHGAAC
ncbi:MAG: hypothetical protein R3231_08815 [bacterium]|nr:hypothetical protein [bacterium]